MKKFLLALSTFIFVISASSVFAETKPDLASIPFKWTDDSEKAFSFKSLLGQQYVLAMVYTTCRAACPLIVHKLESIDKLAVAKGLSPKFVLVTFDPERDTPSAFNGFRKSHSLPDDKWILLNGGEQNARKLSVLLGVSYQKDPETGDFSHSNQLTFVDKTGVVNTTLAGLNSEPEPLVEAMIKDARPAKMPE